MKRAFCSIVLAWAAMAQTAPALPGVDRPKPAAAASGRGNSHESAPGAPAGRGGRGTTASAAAGLPSPRELKFPQLRMAQVPALTAFTLPNGMKVYLQEDHELPMINGSILVRTGSVFDPPDRIGLAQLTGIVLRTGGTALKSGEQLDDLLQSMGANIDSAMTQTAGTMGFSTLKENAASCLQLVREILTQPGFRQEKIDQAKTQLRIAIQHRNDRADTIAGRELRGLIYGKNTPYGWDAQYATIDRITRGDIRNFFQRYYVPANVIVGVRGDFDAAAMKALLEKTFGDWNAKGPAVPEFPKAQNSPAPGVYVAEIKDATQAYFAVGEAGGQFSDKDNAAMQVVASLLSISRTRLADQSHGKEANAPEFRVLWAPTADHPGVFEIGGSARGMAAAETISAIKAGLEQVRTAEITDEELRFAREAALNLVIFAVDSKAKLFNLLLSYEYFGYPRDFLQKQEKAIEAVTKTDVLRAAKQYIDPAKLTIVIAGNPALFRGTLDKLGAVVNLDMSIPAGKPEVVESTDSTIAQGKQILAKAQAAAGGADRLAFVRDYSMTAEYHLDPSVPALGGSKITQVDRWVQPTTFRQDSTLPAGRVAAYTDGKVGWIFTPQGWGGLSGTQRNQVFGDLFRVYFRLLLSDRLEGRTVNAIDDSTVQISDTTGQVATVEFDPQTNLPKKISYETPQASGPPIYSEDVLDDFRDIGGIKIPFKITISQGGHKFSDVMVKEYRINIGIKPLDLAKRPNDTQ